MTASDRPIPHRVLLVSDDDAIRVTMNAILESKGFDVVAAAGVTEALRRITTEIFDVLITDLNMLDPGNGLTVVAAMRHSQPDALTLLVSGHPGTRNGMAAILLQADQIILKPFKIARLADLIYEKMLTHRSAIRSDKERVSMVLQRCLPDIVAGWLARAKQSNELACLPLSDEERAGHLPKLIEDLALRLGQGSATSSASDAGASPSAAAHGELRYMQGYTPAMLVHESRLLQVTIFGTLQNNLNHLDFSLLLPDVMTIADEVDSQLTQSMDSYTKLMRKIAGTMATAANATDVRLS